MDQTTCKDCQYFRTRIVEGREYVGCAAESNPILSMKVPYDLFNHVDYDAKPCKVFKRRVETNEIT